MATDLLLFVLTNSDCSVHWRFCLVYWNRQVTLIVVFSLSTSNFFKGSSGLSYERSSIHAAGFYFCRMNATGPVQPIVNNVMDWDLCFSAQNWDTAQRASFFTRVQCPWSLGKCKLKLNVNSSSRMNEHFINFACRYSGNLHNLCYVITFCG